MKSTIDLLTINKWSRPCTKLVSVKAIIIHWPANPGQSPAGVRDYWERRKSGTNGYGSAHFVVGIKGDVLQCIPTDEVAYHCGATSPIRPGSDQYYTDLARQRWAYFTLDYEHRSTNQITIGIELCHNDWGGEPSPECRASAIDLVAGLCRKNNLDPAADVLRHQDIVGYKSCPKWACDNPEHWAAFLAAIKIRMTGE
jgi:N-acetylmuramoyl-L-alanine amidase